ncbi:hypothetical protein WJX73_007900 [Symbiochloris irregularis]|uniref:WAC domain-containing protein n=1 Tax=Symbiochloris irregularis TaxID=706552 RepID=A0AAW1P6F1_9CHLO
MPVLDGKNFRIDKAVSAELRPEQEVWRVRSTGETFVRYSDLLERQNLYRSRVFCCGFTGARNLNLEEALREDEKARDALEKFPMELEESALRIVHNTYATVGELVERIYAAHRPGKENTQDAPDAQQPKAKHPLPRPLIRSWLFEAGEGMKMEGRQLWRAKPALIEKYNLSVPPTSSPSSAPGSSPQAQADGGLARPVPVPQAAKPAGNGIAALPAVASSQARPVAPPATLQQDEARLQSAKPLKLAAFQVLRNAGAQGLKAAAIVEACRQVTAGNQEEWDQKKNAAYLRNALAADQAFVRVAKGVFALRSIAGNVDFDEPPSASTSDPTATKKRKLEDAPQAGGEAHATDAAAAATAGAAPPKAKVPKAPKPAALEDPGQEFATLVSEMRQHASDADKAAEISTKATQLLFAHREALQQAEAGLERARHKAKTSPPKKSPVKIAEPAGEMPDFEVPAAEREYKGDPEDRKALMAHRSHLKAREKEMERQRLAWLAARQPAPPKPSPTINKALRQAEAALSTASAFCTKAETGAAEVLATLNRVLTAEKVAADKAAREAARLVEKERKAAEAAEAKRYPLEDLELLAELRAKALAAGTDAPAEDVPLPEMLMGQESEALATTLYASDFLSQFADELKLHQAISFQRLHEMLTASRAISVEDPQSALWSIFRSLMAFILENAGKEGYVRKLKAVLGPGTWPEVMMRYILSASNSSLRSTHVSLAAGMLERQAADSLAPGHLRTLLAFLCDQALDAGAMRDALTARQESADEARANMRKATMEEKRRINEVLAVEKEERKQKREAEAQKKREEEEAAAAAAAAQAATNAANQAAPESAPTLEKGAAGAEGQDGLAQPKEDGSVPPATDEAPEAKAGNGNAPNLPPEGPQSARRVSRPGTADLDGDESEEEPEWELPEGMREWQGDPSDRKGKLLFRQAQQTARQKLEKEKAKWQAAAAQRAQGREAARKARAGLEKARAKEKQSAEQAIMQRRQAYERELSALAIRAEPLGQDRHWRRYWWGLGSQRGCLFVEDCSAGVIGAWTSPQEVAALMAALDNRGLRERGLLAELTKAQEAITLAMKAPTPSPDKAKLATGDSTGAEAAQEAKRQGQRERTQVVLYSPGKAARQPQLVSKAAAKQVSRPKEEEHVGGGLEGAAAHTCMVTLKDLQAQARSAGLERPAGDDKSSWGALSDAVETACDMVTQALTKAQTGGEPSSPSAAGAPAGVHGQALAVVRQQLQCMEATLFAGCGGDTKSEEPESAEERDTSGEDASSQPASEQEASDEEEASGDEASGEDQDDRPMSSGGGRLWPSHEDKAAWLSEVAQAGTIGRLAYCALLLKLTATRPLQKLIQNRQELERLAEQEAQEAKAREEALAAQKAKDAAAAQAKRAKDAKAAEAKQAKSKAAMDKKSKGKSEAKAEPEVINVDIPEDGSPVVLPSLCMNCHDNGETTILLTKIPHFRDIVIYSFECQHCNSRNNEVQFAGVFGEKGVRYTLAVGAGQPDILSRQVVKSDSATAKVPELDFEIPSSTQRGSITTLEGLLGDAAENLRALQAQRHQADPTTAEAIDTFLEQLDSCVNGQRAFTFILDDPAGNSFVESPDGNAPADAALQIEHYERTKEQAAAVGLSVPETSADHAPEGQNGIAPDDPHHGAKPVGAAAAHAALARLHGAQAEAVMARYTAPEEVFELPGHCSACGAECATRMYQTAIPFFKEVIIMCNACDACGYKSSEVKGAGAISDQGRRITLAVQQPADLNRDVIKADSAAIMIPEVDLEITSGTLGGLITTVEGLTMAVIEALRNMHTFQLGDSASEVDRCRIHLGQRLDKINN